MASWASLRGFEPNGLRAALAAVEKLHARALAAPDAPPSLIERLRELLSKANHDEVPALVARLTRRELSAIADLLLTHPERDIEVKAITLGIAAKFTSLVARSWHLLVTHEPHTGLVQIIRAGLADGLANAISDDSSARQRIARWFETDDVVGHLLLDLESSARSFDEWLRYLPSLTSKLIRESSLCVEVRARLLTHGGKRVLSTHHANLLNWTAELSRESRATLPEQFASNYLATHLEGPSWRDDIVDWTIRKFGRPTPDRLVDSWRRIDQRSPGVVRGLLSWLALKDLQKFFAEIKDPHGRFKFWKENFSRDLASVQPLANRQAMLLHLGPIAVVEFAHVGNAAYVYRDSELSWLARPNDHDVGYYKDRTKLLTRPSDHAEFRIFHQSGWQARYANDLKMLIKRARPRP